MSPWCATAIPLIGLAILWRQFGGLGAHARMTLIRAIAHGDCLVQESVTRMADNLYRELMGPNPTKLEEMAIERIVVGWLEMRYIETTYPTPSGQTLAHQRFALQQKEGVQRRYESAIRSLSSIRKLLPASQPAEVKAAPGTHHAGNQNRRSRIEPFVPADPLPAAAVPVNRIKFILSPKVLALTRAGTI